MEGDSIVKSYARISLNAQHPDQVTSSPLIRARYTAATFGLVAMEKKTARLFFHSPSDFLQP